MKETTKARRRKNEPLRLTSTATMPSMFAGTAPRSTSENENEALTTPTVAFDGNTMTA